MSAAAAARAIAAFERHYGHAPNGVSFAPGRVNLIGDHVDYNGGLVLPMPIAQGTAVAWSEGEGPQVRIRADDFDAEDSFHPAQPTVPKRAGWRSYCRGMFAFAAEYGAQPEPLDLAIAGDMPRRASLSSSASVCVAVGRAIADASGVETDPVALSLAAQRTEHDYAGLACGIMDQMAVAAGRHGNALLLDCRSLDYRTIALPEDWGVTIVASGVERELVDGVYNKRRAQCDAALASLGAPSWREVGADDLPPLDGQSSPEVRRAHHVVSEIARVESAVAAMAADDLARFGMLLKESHASLRDLFETSHPQVDKLVAALQDALGTAGGARITGAGFGGSIVAVGPPAVLARAAQTVRKACHLPDHAVYPVHPLPG